MITFRLKILIGFLFIFILSLVVATSVWAVTDSVNVTLEVTSTTTVPEEEDDTPGGGGPINGCTDPLALNYNSSAVVNNGSCVYAGENIPNVTDFVALYTEPNKSVFLSWVNPVFINFDSVRLVRRLGGVPTTPNEGILVYQGPGESVVDSAILLNQTYYYTIFVKSTSGGFSSGVITFAVTSEIGEEPSEETDPPDDPDPTDEPGDPTTDPDPSPNDPFDDFPQTETKDPLVNNLDFGDFVFFQPAGPRQFFTFGSIIRLLSDKETTVYLPYNKVPQTLKAIGVTIVDPEDPNKVFSFLLKSDESSSSYSANIGPLNKPGRYPVFVYIINYQDQTLKRISGYLDVKGPFIFNPNQTFNNALTIGGGAGLLTGLIGAVGLGSSLSLFEMYLLLLRALGSIFGFFGIRREPKAWGTVYDSVTKQPIDPVYVVVNSADESNKEVATAITDIDGRYGFLLPAGAYRLQANKTHYVFPSKILAGQKKDELYDNLYFGEPFINKEDQVVNLNIPLDPVGFDWNEFAKQNSSFFKIYSTNEIKRNRIFLLITTIGFISTSLAVLISPGWLNLGVLFLYLVFFAVSLWWKFYHPIVFVKSGLQGKPVPFAIVRAYYADLAQEAKHVVTDAFGRLYLLLRPGEYYFTVEVRDVDGSYKKIHQTNNMFLPKGVLRKDILF